MQELVQLTSVFSRSFSIPCASFSMLDGPVGTGTIKHCKQYTWLRKASAKNSSKLKFLHSEVNLLIQHIIVQDQDGQNNNSRDVSMVGSDFKMLIGKRPLGRSRRRWEDTIRMDFKEIDVCTRKWIDSAQDRDC